VLLDDCSPDWATEYTRESWADDGLGGLIFAPLLLYTPSATKPETELAHYTKTMQYITNIGKHDMFERSLLYDLQKAMELRAINKQVLKPHGPDHLIATGVASQPRNKNRLKSGNEFKTAKATKPPKTPKTTNKGTS
jgi:hypothetical protein